MYTMENAPQDILLSRPQNYDGLYFKTGQPVLQGFLLPLDTQPFKLDKDLSAPGHWRDDLAAYELDSRNLSYPKE